MEEKIKTARIKLRSAEKESEFRRKIGLICTTISKRIIEKGKRCERRLKPKMDTRLFLHVLVDA